MTDLNPFFKISWNNANIRNTYDKIIASANELSYRAEYEMVKLGLRQANVYHMTPNSFDKQIETITNDGLVFLPILRSKAYSGFSHKHFPVDKLDSDTFVFGVVAQSIEIAQKFKAASLKGDHITQGELLGYPKCCCEAFSKNWSSNKLDPCYESAVNTPEATLDYTKEKVHVNGDACLNTMLRYFGVRIVPFFPCSYQCSEALDVSKNWFEVMKSLNKDVTLKVKELLEQPLTWVFNKGIIYITTPIMRAVVNGYECERKSVLWQ